MVANLDIDRQNDLLYISLSPEGVPIDQPVIVVYSKRFGQDLVLDFDKEDRLVGIELLAASKFIDISRLKVRPRMTFNQFRILINVWLGIYIGATSVMLMTWNYSNWMIAWSIIGIIVSLTIVIYDISKH